MKAAVFENLGKIVVKEVPTPEIDDDSALVRVRACAICGSDVRTYHSGNSRVKPPQILGHEISGEIVEVGKNVTKVKVGDRVAIGSNVPCGECFFCESGMGNVCQENYAIGYQFAGGFAEYMLLNRMTLLYGPVQKIPDNGDFSEYALAEPLGCILNALKRTRIEMGDTVVIIGGGPVGCMMIPVIKARGASKIICIERNPARQKVALDSGADMVINHAKVDIVQEIMKMTHGFGAQVVITATPVPEMQQKALMMARNHGRVNFFGGLPPHSSNVVLNSNLIHYKELIVTGAFGCQPRHHKKAVELIQAGLIDVAPFITEHFSLDEIQHGFNKATERNCMRVIIHPWKI